jgi:hypothetical protein
MKLATMARSGLKIVNLCILVPCILPAQSVETKDGVRIVHNGKVGRWGVTPKISLDFIRAIGDIDADDEHFAFNEPGDIVEDRSGNFYIADTGNCRILKFDKNGKFMASLGRKGQGPGELMTLNSLNADAVDRLYIWDLDQRLLKVLSADGKEVKMVRFLKSRFYGLRLMKNGLFLVDETSGRAGSPLPPNLLKLIDENETVQTRLCSPFDFGDSMTNQSANSLFRTSGPDGCIAVAFRFQNRIEKYSPDGKLLWRSDRPLNYDTKVIEKGRIEKKGDSTRYYSARMNLCSSGVAIDDAGRTWVVTYRRQMKPEEEIRISKSYTQDRVSVKREGNVDLRTTDMFRLEIFDAEGFMLGVIPLNQFVDGIWIFKDHLYLLDGDRGAAYHQYRIIEK